MNDIVKKITKHFCFRTIKCLKFIKHSYIYRFGKIKYIKIERSYLKNTNENTNLKFLLRGIAALFILSIFVMLFPPVEFIFMYLTGTQTKLELLEFIGLGISGIIALFGVGGLLQRATALDKQTKISEEGQVHERFKTATEHLGSDRILVRIAAFNEFYHIVEIKPDFQNTIFNILCAHLLQTITDPSYQKDMATLKEIKPTDEVQNLLNILFKPNKGNLIFGDMNADLAGAYLKGANLQGANLHKTNLQHAVLHSADLKNANLKNADLRNANLQNAFLEEANLQEATLLQTNMQNAFLHLANLQNAYMREANLQGAILHKANLQEAILHKANLQNAQLQFAVLWDAIITQETIMPDLWENMVTKDGNGDTGVIVE